MVNNLTFLAEEKKRHDGECIGYFVGGISAGLMAAVVAILFAATFAVVTNTTLHGWCLLLAFGTLSIVCFFTAKAMIDGSKSRHENSHSQIGP